MKVVGIKHFVGVLENGREYDTYHLFCTPDNPYIPDGCAMYGECPELTKVKAEILHQVVSPDKVSKLIGREISVLYAADKKTVALVKVGE